MKSPSDNAAAVSYAQQMLQQLRVNYLAELPERVNELEQRALDLKSGADFSQQFDELYRKVHSLKGGAGTYGLQIISTICHQLEDTLTQVANDGSKVNDEFMDRCIAYFDLMRNAIQSATQGKTAFPEVELALESMRVLRTDKSLTALLVEPSKVNTALYLGPLKDLPINFSVVDSGRAALDLLLHNPFDLLITGYEVPEMNGLALIAAVRLNRRMNQDIRAILITSSTSLIIPAELQPVAVFNRDASIGAELLREAQRCLQQSRSST